MRMSGIKGAFETKPLSGCLCLTADYQPHTQCGTDDKWLWESGGLRFLWPGSNRGRAHGVDAKGEARGRLRGEGNG